MNHDSLDPRAYAHQRVAGTRPALAFPGGDLSPNEARAWQRRLRARVRALVGLPSGANVSLDARVEKTEMLDGYRRETVTFASRPGLRVFGYFLVPGDLSGSRPAVLCLPGHGRGVDDIVGINEDNTQRALNAPEGYSADFALQCVANGYPTLAIEQISFGHRRDEAARKSGPGASSCTRDSMAALMLGETMTGWRVWDALRALDYLQTRAEADPKRLAVMGISGGGLTALFAAALDTRVRAAVVSGYLNTFADSILAIDHCPDNYVPGLLTVAEMPDVAGLIAPRLLFGENGDRDPIFPRTAFDHAVRQVRAIYAAFNAPAQFDAEVFAGDHRFHGAGAFSFLADRLRGAA